MNENIDAKSLRKSLNWSQSQMAEYLGLERSAVSRMERGGKDGNGRPKGTIERLLRQLAAEASLSAPSSEAAAE